MKNSNHIFSFAGGDMLAKMGAWWFVSYSYYLHKDRTHRNWSFVKTESTRRSVFNRTKEYHVYWLAEVLHMERLDVQGNAGKRGRITIPYELRLKHGFAYNDVVSFEETDKDTIVIRREKICDRCKVPVIEEKSTSLLDVLNSLTVREQKAAFKYLAKRLADLEDD